MSEEYREMVVEGPPLLLKGYLAGLAVARGMDPGLVLFANEVGVDSEGILEQLAEWMHLHGVISHLLVPRSFHGDVKQGLAKASEHFGVKVKSDRSIRSASLPFQFTAYSTKQAASVEDLFARFGDRIRFPEDYRPAETVDPSARGVEAYTAVHEYEKSGHGTVTGSLAAMMELQRAASDVPVLKVGKIRLQHADD